jgi:hypothetical protein
MVALALSQCGTSNDGPSRSSPDTTGAARSQSYQNDGDHDRETDEDADNSPGETLDTDDDYPQDHYHPANRRYHDRDDEQILAYGRAADRSIEAAVRAAVLRYYQAANREDGSAACRMLNAGVARSVPSDYRRLAGASPAERTCGAVLASLFRRLRSSFEYPIAVTGVRIANSTALALIGSSRLPAGQLPVELTHGEWRIVALESTPLP